MSASNGHDGAPRVLAAAAPPGPGQVGRRTFLRLTGTAGAALALPQLLAACGSDGGGSGSGGGGADELKVGLLLELSGVYAVNGSDMRNGFELYLSEHGGQLGGRKASVVVEDIAGDPSVGVQKATKLLRQEKVAVASGIVSSAVALAVRDLFDTSKVPLVISNAGANTLTRDKKSKYLFRTSFSNWQPNYAMGQWVYDNVAKDGVFAVSPDYVAGHEQTDAFTEAYTKAGGKLAGKVHPPFATTQDYQPFLSQIGKANPKAVYAFFSGGEAVTFVKQYAEFGLKDSVPLVGPGFTVEGVLKAQGEAALGVRSGLHYTILLDNPTNKRFVSAYQQKFSKDPTVFSMQSYDAAQLIDLALKKTNGDTANQEAFAEALASAGEIDSPRGKFRLDATTHNPVQSFYVREVRKVGDGLGNVKIGDLGELADPG
jgi:branched-chain amino acid transport system substrate-binding protein